MPDQPARRLRVAHVIVQPVLVWDDGEEMTPADPVAPIQVPLSHLAGLAGRIPDEVRALGEQLAEPQPDTDHILPADQGRLVCEQDGISVYRITPALVGGDCDRFVAAAGGQWLHGGFPSVEEALKSARAQIAGEHFDDVDGS